MKVASGRMKYTDLFFDLDHTLWDFETNSKEVLYELYQAHSLEKILAAPFDDFFERYSFHNKKLWDRYHHGFIGQEELKWKRMWHAMLDFLTADETLARKLSEEYLHHLPGKKALFPYTIEILQYLTDKGYKMHLITNGFEKTQWSKIQNAQIDHFFHSVVTSEKALCLKPHKGIFDFAIEQASCSYSESIMIGDNLDADIKGAMQAGMDTIFVNHIQEEVTVPATYVIHHLRELEEIL